MANRATSRTYKYGSLEDPSASHPKSSSSRSSPSEVSSEPAEQSLLQHHHDVEARLLHPERQRYGRGRPWLAVAIVGAMAVAGTIMATNKYGSASGTTRSAAHEGVTGGTQQEVLAERGPTMQPKATTHTTADNNGNSNASTDKAIAFSVTNFYHTRDGKPGQGIPWLEGVKLAEPHRESFLKVENARDDHDYRWEIRASGDETPLLASATGADATVVFTALDSNKVTVLEVNQAGDITRALSEVVMVKYVRREIRTLTDEERNELLDSVSRVCALILCVLGRTYTYRVIAMLKRRRTGNSISIGPGFLAVRTAE